MKEPPGSGNPAITVEPVSNVEKETWNAGVARASGGSVFQTTHWADYHRAYLGATPYYLLIRYQGRPVGQILVLEGPRAGESFLGGRPRGLGPVLAHFVGALSWREGPLVFEPRWRKESLVACLAALRRLALERGVGGLDESSLPLTEPADPNLVSDLQRLGYQSWRRATVRIDLRAPLERLWKNLTPDVARTPVRKAWRQGLRLIEVGTSADLERYYRLVEAWRLEQGLRPFPFEKYALMREHMGSCSTVFLAEADGEAVGGAGLWHFSSRAYLFSPVQSAAARERRIYAGDFLFWEMIRWCHERRFEYLDLSGIKLGPAAAKEEGIRRFKQKWGGDVIEYPVFGLPLRRWQWMAVDLWRRARHWAATLIEAR